MSDTIKYNIDLKEELLVDIAVKLTSAMNNLKVTIPELSKKSGVKEKVIERILLAKRNVSVIVLLKLFYALNCKMSFEIKKNWTSP